MSKNLPIMKNLPKGVPRRDGGTEEAMGELFGGFAVALLAGVFLIFGVMVLLFRSFFKPITIMSALPLAIGGAFLGLLAFGMSMSIPSLIGLLMLMGLAAKNSILLVEYAIERSASRQEPARRHPGGLSRARAADHHDHAGDDGRHAAHRPRPGQGLGVPPADGRGGDRRLITSTVLSLVLVPVVYEIIDDFENWLKPKLARWTTPREVPGGATPAPADHS
jgi:HAE1 family hydrophobic/amphiphilic exporter-1